MAYTGLSEIFSSRATPVRVALAAAFMSACLTAPAMAQEATEKAAPAAKPAAKADAPKKDAKQAAAPAAPAAGQADRPVWAKICEKVPVVKKDKDGKETGKEEKQACKTMYESFDPNTGGPLVAISIEEGEGIDKKAMTIIVPPGVALPPGLSLAVFQKDQWDKVAAQNKEGKAVKPEELGLKPYNFKFLHCAPTGCVSLTEATTELLDQMKTGVGVMIRVADVSGRVVDLAVPLKGFSESFTGAPVDTKEFLKDRQTRLTALAQKRAEAVERFKKERADMMKKDGGTTTGSTTPAAKPAEKK
jgi:invasion protein IalB